MQCDENLVVNSGLGVTEQRSAEAEGKADKAYHDINERQANYQ